MMKPAFALAIALFALPASAAPTSCDTAETQSALTACADATYRKSDATLNGLYQKITARLRDNPQAKALLVASQRNWIRFRDSECAFQTSAVAGGSIAPMLTLQCRDALTRVRIQNFSTYLSCAEGDPSCPVPPGN